MSTIFHDLLAVDDRHAVHDKEYANQVARLAAAGLEARHLERIVQQTDDESFWRITQVSPSVIMKPFTPPTPDLADIGKILSVVSDGASYLKYSWITSPASQTFDDVYNNESGTHTINVDDGDMEWLYGSNNSWIHDLSGITNTADGVQIVNGSDSVKFLWGAANQLNANYIVYDYDLNASNGVSIVSASSVTVRSAGAATDLTLGGRANNITLNDVSNTALTGAIVGKSIFGALNYLVVSGSSPDMDDTYNNFGGAGTVTVDAGDLTFAFGSGNSLIVDVSSAGASDGFRVQNGTDYWQCYPNGANLLVNTGQFEYIDYTCSDTLSLNSTNEIVLASSSSYIGINPTTVFDVNTATVDIDATGNIAIDTGTQFDINADDSSSINVLFGNLSLTANDSNGSGSVIINAQNNDVDIDAADDITLDAVGLISIDATETIDWSGTNASLDTSGNLRLIGLAPTYQLKETDGSADENWQVRCSNGDLLFQTNNDSFSSAATQALFQQTGEFGIGNITPSYKLSIGSADNSDQVGVYHDNTNAFITTDDGGIILTTDEGTDTNGIVIVRGKGTGYGIFKIEDEDSSENLEFFCASGVGRIRTSGSSPSMLQLQNTATNNLSCFTNATEGLTPELQIHGFRTSDANRSLQIGVGTDEADTASFDGVSNYAFDGSIKAYDEDKAEYLEMYATGGAGIIRTAGSSPGALRIQNTAHDNVNIFGGAASGETPLVQISGYRTGDSKRDFSIGVGVSADDQVDFDGVSNYWFDGDIEADAYILDPSPGTNQTSNGFKMTMTIDAGASPSFGSPLFVASDGELEDADADATTSMPCTALALGASTGAQQVHVYGPIRNDTWNWTVGGAAGLIYVSTTAGTLTQTKPSGTGDQVQPVGYALSADIMFFTHSMTLVEIA